MDLANMRRQGVHHLIAYCLNDSCRHQALIDVSKYPSDTPVPWFARKIFATSAGRAAAASTCGRTGRKRRGSIDDWSGRPA
jgi:hypothetical protein